MKWTIVFVLVTLLIIPSFSQVEKLSKQENLMKKKVKIGMTTDEVKKVIGRPKTIEGGFPNSDELIINEIPEQVGQINNSTWFYIYPEIKISYKKVYSVYYVNGYITLEDIYYSYIGKENIYLYKGEPTDYNRGVMLKMKESENLEISPIVTEKTYIENLPPFDVQESFVPILCIIFDKGTQVVAAQRVYFKMAY